MKASPLLNRIGVPVAVTAGAVLVLIVCLTAVNRQTDSDPMGSLLVADSILSRHTVFLNGYYDDILRSLSTRIEMVDGQPAYMFPIGTSLVALPVVAVLKAMGVGIVAHDHQIQIGMAAAAAVLVYLLLFALARRFLPPFTSLLLALVFWFGSAFASTGASALWSHDFGSVFALLSLLLLVLALQDRSTWPLVVMTIALAAALVIRPQLALMVVGVVIVLAVNRLRAAVGVAAGLVVLAAAFGVVNHALTGQWLPEYYLPQRLTGGEFWTALAGNVVSPARGLLVYSPFLIVLVVFALQRRRMSRVEASLAIFGAAWTLAHLVAISRFPHWWGGWAFGPRLMMDVLPGLFLVTVMVWPRSWARASTRIAGVAFGVLAALAIVVNVGQGLYNPYTRFWYIEPSVDTEPSMVWDWTYPQFLASETGHEARLMRALADPPPLAVGTPVPVGDPSLALVGWSTGFTSPGISLDSFQFGPSALLREDGRRWSEGTSANVVVTLTPEELAKVRGTLRMSVDAVPGQRVDVSVNGVPVHSGVLGSDRGIIEATFDPSVLVAGRNVIHLDLPNAVSVGQASDYRRISVALKQLTLE